MALPQRLIDSTVRHQVYLERLKSGEVKKLQAFLRQIDLHIRKSLLEVDITTYSRTRLEKLLKEVDAGLLAIQNDQLDQMKLDFQELAEYEAGFEARNIGNVASFELSLSVPSATQIMTAVLTQPLSVRGADGGKLLEPFIKDWSKVERDRVVGAIRQGYFEGKTTQQIVQTIRGTAANKYSDGLLAITNRNAASVVNTAVQHVASVARMETWGANADIIDGYRWVSTLDSRTTPQCRSLDGMVFKIGEGPKPPIHVNCRSTTVAELSDEFDWLKEGRTRASKDGPVADQSYYEWLKSQPANFQNDVLGVNRATLFRDGGLSAERFSQINLDRNFKPLTLEQMRKLEPNAFERAGI